MITVDPARRYRLGAVDVDCLHETHQCSNCEAHLLTLRTTSQEHPVFTRLVADTPHSLLETGSCGSLNQLFEAPIKGAAA